MLQQNYKIKTVFKMKYLFCVFNVFLMIGELTAANNDTKGSIGFPEAEEDASLKNKDDRQPVFLPSMCPVNELFYPGDQKDDWICDCRPAHLYHPGSDACWPALQKGPCAVNEYLFLEKQTVIPVCVKNPCAVDGQVVFNGKCERLGSITACEHLFPVAAAVGVNATTLEVGCVKLNLESRFGDGQPLGQGLCKPGSKTHVNGKCNSTS